MSATQNKTEKKKNIEQEKLQMQEEGGGGR